MNKSMDQIKNKIKKLLFSLDYLPRWMVFFMDVFLTICSSVISFLIVRSLNVKFYDTLDIPTRYSIIILIYILYVVVFKTFSGILRFSTFIDGLKLLYATICTFFLEFRIGIFRILLEVSLFFLSINPII